MFCMHRECAMKFLIKVTCVIFLSATVKETSGHKFSACKKQDNDCLNKAIENGIKLSKDGLPEYGLRALDPLAIDKMQIDAGQGVVNLVQKYRNIFVFGLTNVTIRNSSMDFVKKTLTFSPFFPQVTIKASYEVNGKILLLPVQGKGESSIILENLLAIHKIQFEEITKDGTYFDPKTYTVKLFPEHVQYQFDNVFDGNKLLGDNINNVLNREWKAVFEDVGKSYALAFADIFLQYAKSIFGHIKTNDLFLMLHISNI